MGVRETMPTGTVTLLIAVADGPATTPNDDIEFASVPAELDHTLGSLVATHGGVRVDHFAAEGFMAAFAWARDALACGLELQKIPLSSLRLRIGLHTGDLHPSENGCYAGVTVDRVVGLCALAHGGQTLLSGAAAELVIDHLPADAWMAELGAHQLCATVRPERVVQLCHAAEVDHRFRPINAAKRSLSQSLPVPLTSFVGRRDEKTALHAIVSSNRLVTLTGAGGVGKTRLALEVAGELSSDFPDGVWYVDLAPIADPLLVPVTVARTQDLPDQPGRSTTDTLRTFIGKGKILLLLDNCEHLLDACSALIVPLLDECPRMTVLATSREPIAVLGELTWLVPSLSLDDDAFQLFVDRAQRARPYFRATADSAATITDICRRLDGIPLAIELAAARTRTLSLADILENLHDRFALLTGGARSTLRRHQTLRASLDWSHALLTDSEQTLFSRLCVFSGGFDLDAAIAVGADPATPRRHLVENLSHLVDKSLVIADNAGGGIRYRLLETMRQYAMEKLADSGEILAARDRHRDHYIQKAATFVALPAGWHQRLVEWADVELDNLRVAYARSRERGDTETALRLTSSLQPFWLTQGRLREGLAWFHETVPETPGPDLAPEVWVRAVVHADTLAAWLEATTDAERASTALAVARQLDDPALIAETLNVCCVLTRYDAATSRTYVDEAEDLARVSNDTRTLCQTCLYQAIQRGGMEGDPTGAHAAAEEAFNLAEQLGDRFMSWSSQIWLGNALLIQGRLEQAAGVLRPLVQRQASAGQLFMSFYASVFLGRVRSYQGQPDAARDCWEVARTIATGMGGFQDDTSYAMLAEAALAAGDADAAKTASDMSWRHTVPGRAVFNRVLNPMAESLLACGELVAARRWADDSVATVNGSNKIAALTGRAYLCLAQGEPGQAGRDAHHALAIAATTGAFLRVPDALECLARLTVGSGQQRNGARILGAAAAMRHDQGIARFQVYQAGHDATTAALRAKLGDADFDTAWAQGGDLSAEESIAYAQRGRGMRHRPPTGWESLTPTEVAVARLVRDGMANSEIAERLVISRRTVQTHLTHVYSKLGFASRVQLAQEANRHS